MLICLAENYEWAWHHTLFYLASVKLSLKHILIKLFLQMSTTSRKHANIILTPLNPIFIKQCGEST